MQPLVGMKESEEIVVRRVSRRLERFLSELERQRREGGHGGAQFAETPGGHGDSEGTRPRIVAFPDPRAAPKAPPPPELPRHPGVPAPVSEAPADFPGDGNAFGDAIDITNVSPPKGPALDAPRPPPPVSPPPASPPSPRSDEFFPQATEQPRRIAALPPSSRPGSTPLAPPRSVTGVADAAGATPASPVIPTPHAPPASAVDRSDQTRRGHANIPAAPSRTGGAVVARTPLTPPSEFVSPPTPRPSGPPPAPPSRASVPPPVPLSRSSSLATPMRDTSLDAPDTGLPASLAGLAGPGAETPGENLSDSPASQIFMGGPAPAKPASPVTPLFAAPSFYATLLATAALLLLAYHLLLGPDFLR